MNAELAFLTMAAWLAAEVALLVLIAVISERFIRSAHWRRTLWQVCALSVLILIVLELSGAGRTLGESARRRSPEPRPLATIELQVSLPVATMPEPVFEAVAIHAKPAPQARDGSTVLAMVWLWILGTGLLLARVLLARTMMWLMCRKGRAVQNVIVQELAPRLGIRGSVRVMEFARLKGPIAIGRIIGLPPGFEREHSRAQQEVILAHELAHLAARDNWWQLLAEIAVAALWWHPLVWLARRRFQDASETAADEASLLIQNGPPMLAECLLALGKRLEPKPGFGWLNIGGQGFRSGLGRRVQRLFELSGSAWNPASNLKTALAKTFCPAALVLGTVLCSGWFSPAAAMKGTEMKNPMWKRSLPAFAALAFLSAAQPVAAAEKASPSAVAALLSSAAKPSTLRKGKGAAAVRRKLEQITFKEIKYDNLPLAEVIKHLIQESDKQDPEGVGVNFLLQQFVTEVAVAIDPATGLPMKPGDTIDLGATTIRIMPGMRNLRLIDALDAIVKVAERPLRYSIEEYGVVITPATRPQATLNLETRTYQITPPDNFYKGIESAFGIDAPSRDTAGIPSREAQQQVFQELFVQLGIEWGAPRSIFYNELTGIVMVRAAGEEIPLITAAMQTLGGHPVEIPTSR